MARLVTTRTRIYEYDPKKVRAELDKTATPMTDESVRRLFELHEGSHHLGAFFRWVEQDTTYNVGEQEQRAGQEISDAADRLGLGKK